MPPGGAAALSRPLRGGAAKRRPTASSGRSRSALTVSSSRHAVQSQCRTAGHLIRHAGNCAIARGCGGEGGGGEGGEGRGEGERPVMLHEVRANISHSGIVVTTKFSPAYAVG